MIALRYQGPVQGPSRLEEFLRAHAIPVESVEVGTPALLQIDRVRSESVAFVEVLLRIGAPPGMEEEEAIRILESVVGAFKRTVGFPTRVRISTDGPT